MDNSFEHEGFYRLKDVLMIIPVSRSAWWRGVAEGKYPAPIKLGPATTCWEKRKIHELCERLSKAA